MAGKSRNLLGTYEIVYHPLTFEFHIEKAIPFDFNTAFSKLKKVQVIDDNNVFVLGMIFSFTADGLCHVSISFFSN